MQARAVFEAAAIVQKEGIKVRPEIMIPLVGFKKELDLQLEVVHQAARDVQQEQRVKLTYSVGTMIEIPRGALMADEIAQSAEFFSFGTNDLTQTALGMSRDDSGSFLPHYAELEIVKKNPFATIDTTGVGQLVDIAVKRGRATRKDLKLGICGEHGGDPDSIRFFEQDLYGARDFSRRDADLARIVPMMVRMAPTGVVHCVALAVELNALSQELDLALVKQLPRVDGGFTVADYCRAYRRAGDVTGRRRQIALIGEVGAALDRYVHKRLVRTSLAMMRRPAHVAGLSALQDFLERGFAAFRTMDGADEFLAVVRERETRVHDAIVGGRNDPFPDPTVLLAAPEKVRAP